MKKWSMALFAIIAGLAATAQETGMHFEHNTTWEKVLAKAKAEHKYIFVDCFATWCGPCKQMAKNIFPQEEVGKFYNANFVNVKLQFDTTAADNEEVKAWHAVSEKINEEYKIAAYPTYMIFDANGLAVHRAVGSSDAEKFIAKGKEAMVPETQYYTMKRKYEAGDHNENFLYKVAMAATDAYDVKFAKKVSREYLATQKDLYTKDNISLLQQSTETKSDTLFKMMVANPEKVDAVLGKGESNKLIKQFVLGYDVYPKIFTKGGVVANPEWSAIKSDLEKNYPVQANELFLFSKVGYYQRKRDWQSFGSAVSEYMKAYGSDVSAEQMNSFAWTVFQNCNDIACVASALEWSKQSFAENNSHEFMDTYANLLYKSGKKKEAIEWETKAMELAQKNNENTGDYKETLNKMNKGEQTW